jgi:excisionase family DNA binding protein
LRTSLRFGDVRRLHEDSKHSTRVAFLWRRPNTSGRLWRMNAQTDMTHRLAYPIPEAAHLLGISPRGVYRLIETSELHTVMLGRRRLVPRQELERLVTPQECRA